LGHTFERDSPIVMSCKLLDVPANGPHVFVGQPPKEANLEFVSQCNAPKEYLLKAIKKGIFGLEEDAAIVSGAKVNGPLDLKFLLSYDENQKYRVTYRVIGKKFAPPAFRGFSANIEMKDGATPDTSILEFTGHFDNRFPMCTIAFFTKNKIYKPCLVSAAKSYAKAKK